MLSKAHLTSHSRMSGSRWLITPSWLSHLLLLLGPVHFCPLSSPSLHEVIPWYLSFSWRDLESFPLCCFPLVLCTVRSWRLSYHSLLFFGTMLSAAYIFHFLLCFSLLFTAICKASSESDFAFLPFFFLGMVLIPVSVQCHEPLSIVHQALYQI